MNTSVAQPNVISRLCLSCHDGVNAYTMVNGNSVSTKHDLVKPPGGDMPDVTSYPNCERCHPDYVIDRANFPYLGLEFVASGTGSLSIAGQETALTAGLVFCYGPGVAHRIVADRDDPPSKYFVDFAGTDAIDRLRECRLGPGALCHVGNPVDIQRVFDDLVHDGSRGGAMAVRDTQGGIIELRIQYERALPLRTKQDQKLYSAVEPTFYRIYKQEMAMDLVKSIPTGVDHIKNYRFNVAMPKLKNLFNGNEQFVAVIAYPMFVRQIFLP